MFAAAEMIEVFRLSFRDKEKTVSRRDVGGSIFAFNRWATLAVVGNFGFGPEQRSLLLCLLSPLSRQRVRFHLLPTVPPAEV